MDFDIFNRDEDFWAYLAGLIDADGTITIERVRVRNKNTTKLIYTYRPVIYIFNCNKKFSLQNSKI